MKLVYKKLYIIKIGDAIIEEASPVFVDTKII